MPDTRAILRARRARRIQAEQTAATRRGRLGVGLGLIISLLLAGLIFGAAYGYAGLTRDLPSIETLPGLLSPPDGQLLQPTRLYDRSGGHPLFTFAPDEVRRRYVPLSAPDPQYLPASLVETVIAVADPGFREHGGYSTTGLEDPDLHPTLAQRLAYDLLLYDEPPSLRRALRERLLAAEMTRRFGREQVLEWYVNSVHYGRYAFGADAAARLYFGKPAEELTLAESALLAAASEAPALNPQDAPQAAMQRGREVLRLLDELGAADHAEVEQALANAPQIAAARAAEVQPAAAFINLALAQLEQAMPRARLERGGLNVITTLDYDLQSQTSCVTEFYAARLGAYPEPSTDCEAALTLAALPPGLTISDSSASAIVIDPKMGQVLALAGETRRGRETPLFSAHDPGSAMDVFAYLTGFTAGLGPGSLVLDIPPAGESLQGAAAEAYHGPLRLRNALASDLRAPAKTAWAQMGAENVQRTIQSFGLPADEAVTPLDLGGAFGALGTQGVYFGQRLGDHLTPTTVLAVETLDGRTLLDWSIPQATSVVSPGLAYVMTHALSDESARELLLGRPNVTEIGRPAAVKLARSDEGLAAWAIGYTPQRVVVAWTGSRSAESGLTSRVPAVLYAGLMQYASRGLPTDGWAAPADVVTMAVCDPSGLLPTDACPKVVNEVFLSGNEPHQPDNLYRKFVVNRETGFLATVFTPAGLVEERVYIVMPREAEAWAQSRGLPLPPTGYDAIHVGAIDPDVNIEAPGLFEEVKGTVRVTGTAAGEGFASYRVLAGSGINPQQWIEIGSGTSAVEDGLLATWDTDGLSGLCAVQLIVTRGEGRIETAVTQVMVGE